MRALDIPFSNEERNKDVEFFFQTVTQRVQPTDPVKGVNSYQDHSEISVIKEEDEDAYDTDKEETTQGTTYKTSLPINQLIRC